MPGILQGSVNWLGRASECRDVDFYEAQQHLVRITIKQNMNSSTEYSVFYGVCFSKRCSGDDILTVFDTILGIMNNTNVIKFEKTALLSEDSGKYDATFAIAVFVFLLLGALVMVGTGLDYLIVYMRDRLIQSENSYRSSEGAINDERDPESSYLIQKGESGKRSMKIEHLPWCKFLIAFSLATNIPKLISTKSGEGSILCLNGIRVMSLGWVILGHTMYYLLKLQPGVAMYWNNFFYSFSYFQRFNYQVIGNATLSVDSFFVLSAFLLTYLTLKKMKKADGHIKAKFWILFYVRRYIRLTPAMALIILFTIGIWKVLGNDSVPRWQPGINQVDGCEKAWWANLLYVNNLYTSNFCLGWTWYLANDFQFFAISPVLVYYMYKQPKIGFAATASLTILSAMSNFIVSYVNNYPPSSSSRMINVHAKEHYNSDGVFINLYIKPWNRFCSYGVGMLFGFMVFKSPPKFKGLSLYFVALGWVMFWGVSIAVLYGTYGVATGDFPSRFMSAVYNCFSRPAWSCCICWLIWACMYGYAGFINSFLSMRIWIPLSRLTYMTYLVHILVIQYLYMTADSTFNFSSTTYAVQFVANAVLSYAFAFICVLLLESPVVGIEKLLIG